MLIRNITHAIPDSSFPFWTYSSISTYLCLTNPKGTISLIHKFRTHKPQIVASLVDVCISVVSFRLYYQCKLAWLQIQQSESIKNKIKNDKHYFVYIPEQIGNQQDEGKHTEEEIHGQHSKQTYPY